MSYDYAPDVQFAKDLIAEYGRFVTLMAWDSSPADPTQPWRVGDVTTTPDKTEQVYAAWLSPSAGAALGITASREQGGRKWDAILLLPQLDSGDSLEDFNAVQSMGVTYRIDKIEDFTPGETTLLYYAMVVK